MAKLLIGTSGWAYSHWDGIFYPDDLPGKNKLKYFSRHFKTTEINYSFYRLPRPSTYRNWYAQVPADFIFSVKAGRFITHIKRLQEIKEAWKQFVENTLSLKEKLGPFLFQFPPSFRATSENIKRLESFLELYPDNLKLAFEFRHKSWCQEKVYKLLKKYNAAWVIADSPRYPKAEVITADFVYVRMHGSQMMFSSNYTKKELSSLARKIKRWSKKGLDVYVYFNNDASGYAVKNAKELLKLC